MFEIFVDSAANIPAELVKAFKIKVLSFVNLVNGKEMTCFDPDLTPEEERQKGKDYYDMVRAGADIKTGLISSGVFEDAFREALEADKDVLYFSLSKNISGNYNSARIAAEDLMESGNYARKIRMIDSLNASLARAYVFCCAGISVSWVNFLFPVSSNSLGISFTNLDIGLYCVSPCTILLRALVKVSSCSALVIPT